MDATETKSSPLRLPPISLVVIAIIIGFISFSSSRFDPFTV